jgi:hypothetical protein
MYSLYLSLDLLYLNKHRQGEDHRRRNVFLQAPELWSPNEEVHMRPGHNWLLKFGKVPGGVWRPGYAWYGSEADTRHGYQEVRTLRG